MRPTEQVSGFSSTMRFFAVCLATWIATPTVEARAEDPAEVLPSHARLADVMTPADFFGFAIGSRHLRHDQVVDYLEYLSTVSNRVELLPYGRTHGKRPLMVAAISSPANIDKLESLPKKRRRLTSGSYKGKPSDEQLVMYLGYSVHGDESSAVNAVPLVAYHLASSEDAEVAAWLELGVYLVDPALNPDGVDRFANWANETRGVFPSASSVDREHVQPWPGGRTNYYWFDLNRDWLPSVHPESQGRLKLFHTWKPNVVLDFHEMGGTSSYFFQPGIPARNNPLSPSENLALTRTFAQEHIRRMDEAGENYFTEERFDDFYPGKGSTYPDLHGAIGILFEQGSTRGLKLKNDRTDRSFGDTVANQVRMSLSSLTTANRIRSELVDFQTRFYNESLEAGKDAPTTAYLLVGTSSRLNAAAQLLRRHNIASYMSTDEVRVNGSVWAPSEVLIVPSQQPEFTFIRSLMEPLEDFRENIFYDVSTWHLPSAFDLQAIPYTSTIPESWVANAWKHPGAKATTLAPEMADKPFVGYAFSPVELATPSLVVAMQQAGASLRVATLPFTAMTNSGERTMPLGSFLVLKQGNAKLWPMIEKRLNKTASMKGIELVGLSSGWTPNGPDLGSTTTLQLPKSTPLLLVGEGTRSYEAGAIWHFLDTRMKQPATLIDAPRLSSVTLSDYTSVVMPGGSYSGWGDGEAQDLRDYLSAGGTLIACTSSIRWLERNNLLSASDTQEELASVPAYNGVDEVKTPTFGEASNARALESIAGVFLQTQCDVTHPLAYGLPDDEVAAFRDHTLQFPAPKNPYQLVAKYTKVIAGYVSQRNRERLRDSAAVWVQPVGRGRIICLADNPVFRGYVRSTERFLTNALLIGPSLRIPSAPTDDEAHGAADSHGHNH
ncbi:MAG: M14 family zinc carboxypeptidase [Pirellulaceae bacterium]